LNSSLAFILLRILNLLPKKVLLKLGYSTIGKKIVKSIKASKFNENTWQEVGFGVKMYVDFVDPHTWGWVLKDDKEQMIKQVFVDNIKEGSIIIDAGAHLGEFTLIAAKKIGPAGKVIAIEPMKEGVSRIKKNLILNNLKNYEIIEKAVGNKVETRLLYQNDIGLWGNLEPVLGLNDNSEKREIEVDTLDNIISRENKIIDMLKIDVDGFEYELLLGCQESFKSNKIKNIICEIHFELLKNKGLNKEKILDFLQENGFYVETLGKTREKTMHILARKK